MWLLENEDIFKGKSLGPSPVSALTSSQAAVSGFAPAQHISLAGQRPSHLTITVAPVGEGQSQHVSSRSSLTIEDLATKIGTEVDGHKIKGSKYVVTGSKAELMMGKCPSKFRIEWFPVVLTFSFTSKELQAQPLTSLRERFENLDIKLLTDYNPDHTTHVVSKKRNTAKGLQALIYGKYVVAESFLNALAQAAEPSTVDGVSQPSLLESDFGRHWPDALQHLPPRGGEPVQHPDAIYAPDPGRKDVFDGYTFIFYDKTQYNNLVAPITDGCGKAMLRTISPGEESAEDFVRYVKGVAGEKGLGCFDDGSEGRGVVLVRYLPGKGDMVCWYTEFITAVSLRLDHRPVEQNEFLEAILTRDASKLRRPLEVENSQPAPSATLAAADPSPHIRDVEIEPGAETTGEQPRRSHDGDGPEEPQPPAPRRGANRRPVKKRFAGFDDGMDLDTEEPSPANRTKQAPQPEPEEEEQESGLFVSQEPDISQTLQATYSTRKRKASPPPVDDLMDGMAPAAARFKRQRLQSGKAFASPSPEPPPPAAAQAQTKKKQHSKKMDVLALAGRHREEEEARARAEREDLAQLPDGIDLAEIRRLNIVEEMDVRRQGRTCRTREQDIADGRWNPKWNGVRNFKKFRPRGEQQGRMPARVIVPLTQVKDKEFGIGDNYWLEDESTTTPHTKASAPPQPQPQQQQHSPEADVVVASSDDSQDTPLPIIPTTRKRSQAAKQSQTPATSRGRGKRPAPEEDPEPRGGKRRRAVGGGVDDEGGNESDDELKFRFGRRR
ncbi:hypothetical protein CDD80_5868 [Ophiocordyceps camponoti-rufipedis]|uniref:Nibrin second BRCT domain-containing protein n=1 Tax=Ophiocordyceps camponoti-rufipedis TaxID=2004952 RepID=A0A2C5YT07_9HYPO|nr:hypothetical protein CDD80_5868 [Ophiocordyceps camponoti-rufipedis]